MAKRILLAVLLLAQLPAFAVSNFAQQPVGIPIKIKEAFVLEIYPANNRLVVDPGENNFTTAETVDVFLNPQTTFINHKDKPLDRTVLRPGMKLEIAGERLGNQINAQLVKVKINVENWEVEVKGYFEKLSGDRAKIDGQTVILGQGISIKGVDEWKNKTFATFNETPLGAEVEVKGLRRNDGIIEAKQIKISPNLLTHTDRKLIGSVQSGLVVPPQNKLSGGSVKIGEREFKLVENLEMQSYVTRISYKLIPRYMKDLPADDPSKLTFRFYVIEDDSFNAFALPDGSVFVHTGLLKQLKNEAQLAAVVGHEIAHATYEHARRRYDDPKTLLLQIGAIGARTLGKATGKDFFGLMGEFGAGLMSNKYGRNQEDQADRVGLFYMYEAGYDPREAAKVWREVLKHTKESGLTNFIYSDHSTAKARISNLNREIAYNYYDTDFRETIIGADSYAQVVGVYFGWAPKVAPPTVNPSTGTQLPTNTLVRPKGKSKKPLPIKRRKN